MGFHFMDLVVILVIGLLIFGPKKLQEMSRSTGKMMKQVNEFKDKMLAELPVEEISEVTRAVPRVPSSPVQAFQMLTADEKPESAKQEPIEQESVKQEPAMQEPAQES
ncbi:MAG TPA: twin-arginine translocase TatA/TatE family subunit [Ktedonobacteraceae bacterium]|nr:twin-arginine translocase TatA/TatE family subunit [Ktedonobacteraceae bacterium]